MWRSSVLLLLVVACRTPCPKCPEPVPPPPVVLKESCAPSLPTLVVPELPDDVAADGSVHVSPEAMAALYVLLRTVRVYFEDLTVRCGLSLEHGGDERGDGGDERQ